MKKLLLFLFLIPHQVMGGVNYICEGETERYECDFELCKVTEKKIWSHGELEESDFSFNHNMYSLSYRIDNIGSGVMPSALDTLIYKKNYGGVKKIKTSRVKELLKEKYNNFVEIIFDSNNLNVQVKDYLILPNKSWTFGSNFSGKCEKIL